MAGTRRDVVDTIIAYTFRYILLFGLTTHVYDTSKQRLVHSRKAHCYSLLIHLIFVGFAPVSILIAKDGNLKKRAPSNRKSELYGNLGNFLGGLQLLAICLSIIFQWTTRRNAPTLFNEIIQMWHKNVAHLQSTRQIRQKAARLFVLKVLTSALIVAHICHSTFAAVNAIKGVREIYKLLIFNITIAVMFLLCSGLVFSQYIFQILNHNLERVVEDIAELRSTQRPRYALRHKIVVLERKLSDIGRVHAQLQDWVVRFKNLFQIELLVIITMFFILQVGVLFILFLVMRLGKIALVLLHFLRVCSTALFNILDLLLLCYICGELLDASDEAGQIIRAVPVPEHGLCSIQLERCVDLTCIQFKIRRLRLRICGLVDLNWGQSFAMSEAAFLYILLLVEMNYDKIRK